MSVSTPAAGRANGAVTALNVIVSPKEAFQTLRVAPMWGWAFLIAVVLTAIGQYLSLPATAHAVQASWPAQVASNPGLAGMTPEQQQNALNTSLAFIRFSWIFSFITVFIGAIITAVIMLAYKAAGRGDAGFKELWCASMNVAVVSSGIYAIVAGLVAMVRGPASYNSVNDAYRAVPSLAWMVPHAGIKTIAFLAAFNPISIWGAVLVGMAMIYVARTSKGNATACGVTVIVVVGAMLAAFAR